MKICFAKKSSLRHALKLQKLTFFDYRFHMDFLIVWDEGKLQESPESLFVKLFFFYFLLK